MGHHVVVVAGGDPPTTHSLPDDAWIIAADSGVDTAYAMGWHVDVAIGDFDSVSADGLERARREGARVIAHPAEKDHTDLELALAEAQAIGATDIVVIGAGGGRLDHFLANVLVLASPVLAPARVVARIDEASVQVVRGGEPPTWLDVTPGALVTLVPVHGAARGVTTAGLRYPLHREDLPAGTSRGVSNVVETTPASVQLDHGTLVVIVPGQGEMDA